MPSSSLSMLLCHISALDRHSFEKDIGCKMEMPDVMPFGRLPLLLPVIVLQPGVLLIFHSIIKMVCFHCKLHTGIFLKFFTLSYGTLYDVFRFIHASLISALLMGCKFQMLPVSIYSDSSLKSLSLSVSSSHA